MRKETLHRCRVMYRNVERNNSSIYAGMSSKYSRMCVYIIYRYIVYSDINYTIHNN